MEFLDVVWRTLQHYGVEINGRRYDGSALNFYRGALSPFGGAHAGRWPIMVDRDDVRSVFFQDPETKTWHTLEWEHAEGLTAPFSAEAAEYTRKLALRSDRHVAPDDALNDLLERHSKGEVTAIWPAALPPNPPMQHDPRQPQTQDRGPKLLISLHIWLGAGHSLLSVVILMFLRSIPTRAISSRCSKNDEPVGDVVAQT